VQIPKGKYRLDDRNLNFDIVADLNFDNSGGRFYFRGGNGFGKTSFLEKIIIPALKAGNIPYLYIGQDIRTQLYTLRALLSIRGVNVSDADEAEILRLWIHQGQSARVLILDEFDKYFPDYGFIYDWSAAFIRTYIIVTHLAMNHRQAAADNYPVCNVRFELINPDGHFKNVRVRNE
jgi:zona occludens toxin (predicted ATPase)